MKHAFRLVAGTALLALGAALAACHPLDASGRSAAESMELKLYDVPAGQSESLRNALGLAMAGKASVSQAAPGQLLVYAPHGAQASIGDAIAALGKTIAKQAAPVQVDVHFWVIDGEQGAGNDDPALKELAASLASLRQAMGPLHFHLDQVAALVGTTDQAGSLTTAPGMTYDRSFHFRVTSIAGDTAQLQLRYQDNGASGLRELDTRIDTNFGQYLVLAQAPGTCPAPVPGVPATGCSNKPAMRLLVVRVDRLPTKA